MGVLIVCKAVTVWTQVIFTMLVSNRVPCTRFCSFAACAESTLHTQGRPLETHKHFLKHKNSGFSTQARTHARELHSITIRSTQKQREAAWCKGQKSQHLHGKVKSRAQNNPTSRGHECNCHDHSPTIFPV